MADDIKILDHLNIDLDGDGIAERYEIGGISELPIASSEVLGGVKVGENLSIMEDGTLNAEASGTSVLSPGAVLYDTEEKIVGKWIDGKPIYEKVIYVNIVDRDWHNIQMDVSIDNVIKLKGILYQGNSYPYFIELQGNTYPNTNERAMLLYKKDENYIRYGVLYTQTDLTSTYLYITIQYTKTTDEENSFNIGMVENINLEQNIDFSNIYSTDERIIGSWINGKPIYQKTYFISNTVTLTTSWIQIIQISEDVEFLLDSIIYDPYYNNNMYLIRYKEGYLEGFAPINTLGINENSYITIRYTKMTDEENSFTPDMIIDHENITDAKIADAAAADKI